MAADADKKEAKLELSTEEATLLKLTNEAREKEKLEPLKANAILLKVARAHAANMARKGEMNHVLDGMNPSQRVRAAGYAYAEVGENIASGEDWSLEVVFKSWMDSPEHRENILNDKFKEIGIGLAKTPRGEIYYAQVFGTRKQK